MVIPPILKTILLKLHQNFARKFVALIAKSKIIFLHTALADFAPPFASPLLASILRPTTVATPPYDIAGASAAVDTARSN
jgi:hypothetical protein